MNRFLHNKQSSFIYKILCSFVAVTFGSRVILPPPAVFAQTVLNLPVPGTIVPPSPGFMPVQMTGLTIYPDNPLRFDFIMDTGHSGLDIHSEEFKQESTKLIKYFMASLTTPEEELWVNLSPYEKDRMIPADLGKTEMGRDMLAQDYLLKQLTASLMYPEQDLGKEFWKRVYQKAREKFGTTEIPLNTFNKIWIVPEDALVYEQDGSVFVIHSKLAVMLEEDYEALRQSKNTAELGSQDTVVSGLQSQVVREVLIPEITKEINEGKNFSNLRQIFNALILATWYKVRLKESLLGKVYVNQGKTKGIDVQDKEINEKIYTQYLDAFKKGVYNYIREDYDESTQQVIPRKYFSGGVSAARMRNGKWFSQFLLGGLVLGLTAFSALPSAAQEEGKNILEGVGNQAGVTAEFVENSPDDLTVTVHNGKNVRPLLLAQAAPLSMKKQGARVKGQEFSIDKDASSPVEQILQEANRKGLDKILFVFDIGGTITGWDKQNVESRGGFQEVSKNLGDLIEHGYYLGASDFPQAAALLNSHGHALAFISTATLEEMLGLMHEKMGIKDLSGVRLIVAKSSKGAYLHHLGAKGYYGISPEITTSQDLLSYLRERYPGTTILLNALPKEEIVKLPEVLSVLENQPFVSIGDSEGDYKWAASFPRGNGQAAEGITDTTKDVSIAKPINAGIRTLLEKQAAPSPVKIVMDSPRRLTPNERDAIKADNVPLDELWKVWDRLGTFVTQLSEQITKNNSSTLRNLLTVIQEDYQFVESAVERRLEIDTSSPVGEKTVDIGKAQAMLRNMPDDYYERLGVSKTDDRKTIQKAYWKLVRSWHPQNYPDASEELRKLVTEITRKFNEAWETLKNDEKRKRYDSSGPYHSAGFSPSTADDDSEFYGVGAADFRFMSLEEILNELNNEDTWARVEAIDALRNIDLSRISAGNVKDVSALAKAIKHNDDGFTRYHGIGALGRIARDKTYVYSRMGVAEGAGRTPRSIATQAIIELLETDPHQHVRGMCIIELFQIADADSIRALIKNITQNESFIRDTIEVNIIALANDEKTGEITVTLLDEALANSDRDSLFARLLKDIRGKIKPVFVKTQIDVNLRMETLKRMLTDLSLSEEGESFVADNNWILNIPETVIILARDGNEGYLKEVLALRQDLIEESPAFKAVSADQVNSDGLPSAVGIYHPGGYSREWQDKQKEIIRQWLNTKIEQTKTMRSFGGVEKVQGEDAAFASSPVGDLWGDGPPQRLTIPQAKKIFLNGLKDLTGRFKELQTIIQGSVASFEKEGIDVFSTRWLPVIQTKSAEIDRLVDDLQNVSLLVGFVEDDIKGPLDEFLSQLSEEFKADKVLLDRIWAPTYSLGFSGKELGAFYDNILAIGEMLREQKKKDGRDNLIIQEGERALSLTQVTSLVRLDLDRNTDIFFGRTLKTVDQIGKFSKKDEEVIQARLKGLLKSGNAVWPAVRERMEELGYVHFDFFMRSLRHNTGINFWNVHCRPVFNKLKDDVKAGEGTLALYDLKYFRDRLISSISSNEPHVELLEKGDHFQTADVVPLIKERVELYRAEIEKKGLVLEFALDQEKLMAESVDLNYLRLIVDNLLQNAIKYTDRGKIVMRLYQGDYPSESWREKIENAVVLVVEDTGIGIPEGEQRKIAQGGRASNVGERPGSGLGLDFVRHAVFAMEGQFLTFSEGLGKGAQFIVALRPASSPAVSQGTGDRVQGTEIASNAPGGIDLNPALLNLQIKRDGNGVPLPLPMQPIENMHIDGFLPVIINIVPVTDLPFLLGLDLLTQQENPVQLIYQELSLAVTPAGERFHPDAPVASLCETSGVGIPPRRLKSTGSTRTSRKFSA